MLIVATLLATQIMASEPHPKHKASVSDSSNMTLVEVQNNRNVPVTVYAQDSSGEVKLGVVGADSDATFQMKKAITLDGDVDFFVHPKGQQTEETGNVELRPGDRLAILVPEKH